MRGFRQGRVAAAFMAIAGAMLGEDAVLKRRQEQESWNRDPATFSDWRKKQHKVPGFAPALYLNADYQTRAHVRVERWYASQIPFAVGKPPAHIARPVAAGR
ncbi:MAG TPA: hypothetical protein DEP24_14000 [Mycobacterium sp.]|nr:hypothetical protein [Mycobacterium sp.]